MKLAIIIVNYRTARLVCDCLQSLFAEIVPGQNQVVVVDNASDDGSVEMITQTIAAKGWQDWVRLLPLNLNGGFAYGNNRALDVLFLKKTYPDYIWFLNPDTIVQANACRCLVNFLQNHSTVGIVGSRLEALDGSAQVSAFRDHSIANEFLSGARLGFLDKLFSDWLVSPLSISEVPHRADWVSGASMMVRREVIEQVGQLDEEFFMYFEEVDFILQARRKNWTCWYVPESRVVHFEAAASGIVNKGEKAIRRPTYWFESRRRFFLKNHNWWTLLLADTAWMLGFVTWRARRILQCKADDDPPNFLKDFFFHSIFVKGFRL